LVHFKPSSSTPAAGSERIFIHFLNGFFRLIGRMSPNRRDWVAKHAGKLLYRIDEKHRNIALSNLTGAFQQELGKNEIESIARRVFENLIRILIEIGWSVQWQKEDFRRVLRVQGIDHFQDAYRKGKGVLFLTAHMGNWELLPVLGSLYRFPVNVLYRPLDYPPLDRFVREMRSRFGAAMIPTARAARKVLQCLRRGEIVAILLDQNVDWYEGVFVDFFGRRACTNKGMALIALKTGAPVLPIFLYRENEGFAVEIDAPLPLIRTGDKTRDVEANTQLYNNVIERFVRRYPDQWFWVHQRWKTRPYQPWPREKAT
jgi:KDO2-lipid IV(A) lauroyltransferase